MFSASRPTTSSNRSNGRIHVLLLVACFVILVTVSVAAWWFFPSDGTLLGMHPGGVSEIQFANDGQTLLTSSERSEDLRAWDFRSRTLIKELPGTRLVAASRATPRIAVHDEPFTGIRILNTKTWNVECRLRLDPLITLRSARISADGSRLFALGYPAESQPSADPGNSRTRWCKLVWNITADSEAEIADLIETEGRIDAAVLSPDSHWCAVAATGLRSVIRVIDLETGKIGL